MEMTGNGNKYAFQSEEMEATNDEVVTFEQNEKNNDKKNNEDNRTEQEKVESLPPIIQKIFKWQISRHRFLAFSMYALIQGLNIPLFIGYLFNNAAVGIAIGVYMVLFQLMCFSFPDYGKGVFLTIFVENQEKIAKHAKTAVAGNYFMTFICTGFFMTFQILALNPESRSHNVFGWITPYLIYANFVIYPIFNQIGSYMMIADACVTEEYSKYWVKNATAYIAKIKECLLKYDAKEDNKDECLEEISKAHTKVETIALDINTALKASFGLFFSFFLGFIILSVILIGVLQTLSTNGSRTAEIIGLSSVTVATLAFFLFILMDATNINKTWEKQRKLVLNDPRLQIKINALFGARFNEWMDNHEAKAVRAFNFQITPVRVMEVGSAIGSLLTIVGYFIVREELRAFM